MCSAVLLDENCKEGRFNLTKTGLIIKNRKGEDIRVTFRGCDIAFQIGEILQVQSGGILHATPHSVVVSDDIADNFGRSSFVLFMEPNRDEIIDIPVEAKYEDIKTGAIYNVPKIEKRFRRGMTFGEFNDITLNYYYSMNKNI